MAGQRVSGPGRQGSERSSQLSLTAVCIRIYPHICVEPRERDRGWFLALMLGFWFYRFEHTLGAVLPVIPFATTPADIRTRCTCGCLYAMVASDIHPHARIYSSALSTNIVTYKIKCESAFHTPDSELANSRRH